MIVFWIVFLYLFYIKSMNQEFLLCKWYIEIMNKCTYSLFLIFYHHDMKTWNFGMNYDNKLDYQSGTRGKLQGYHITKKNFEKKRIFGWAINSPIS